MSLCKLAPLSHQITAAAARALAAAALLIVSVSLSAAGYGQRFLLDGVYLQSTDQKSSDIGNSNPGCGSAIVCYVLFQRVPNAQDLLIEHVSCVVEVAHDSQFRAAQLISKLHAGSSTATSRIAYVAPTLTASVTAGSDTYIVDAAVQYPLKAGEYPVLQLFKNALGTWLANCTLSGHVITP